MPNALFQAEQMALATAAEHNVFTCPAKKRYEVDIWICNQDAGASAFSVRLAGGGEFASDGSQFLHKLEVIGANSTVKVEHVVVIGTDVIAVSLASGNGSVNVMMRKCEKLADFDF